ncbi:hypothetical protein H4Q26_009474 [Puccinia striiformis f. sp. tritici PST-130]|nr:hypothetical protein H4Q26_009474 [Puccinia striiformis f. sp. tritici PST-130]
MDEFLLHLMSKRTFGEARNAPEVAEVFGRISLFLRNTTAIEDNAPDDSQLALIETASTPSHSPVSAATLNEPTVQAATVFLSLSSLTLRPAQLSR